MGLLIDSTVLIHAERILAAVPCVPIALAMARVFGQLDTRLRGEGRPVPTSDLLIASTALARGDDVVTGNLRHFQRVPGLTVHAHPAAA